MIRSNLVYLYGNQDVSAEEKVYFTNRQRGSQKKLQIISEWICSREKWKFKGWIKVFKSWYHNQNVGKLAQNIINFSHKFLLLSRFSSIMLLPPSLLGQNNHPVSLCKWHLLCTKPAPHDLHPAPTLCTRAVWRGGKEMFAGSMNDGHSSSGFSCCELEASLEFCVSVTSLLV